MKKSGLIKNVNTRSRCIAFLFSFFAFGLLFFFESVFAQEQGESEVEQTEQQGTDSTPAETEEGTTSEEQDISATSNSEDRINQDGGFVPSEEISEDLPVSFPIDI